MPSHVLRTGRRLDKLNSGKHYFNRTTQHQRCSELTPMITDTKHMSTISMNPIILNLINQWLIQSQLWKKLKKCDSSSLQLQDWSLSPMTELWSMAWTWTDDDFTIDCLNENLNLNLISFELKWFGSRRDAYCPESPLISLTWSMSVDHPCSDVPDLYLPVCTKPPPWSCPPGALPSSNRFRFTCSTKRGPPLSLTNLLRVAILLSHKSSTGLSILPHWLWLMRTVRKPIAQWLLYTLIPLRIFIHGRYLGNPLLTTLIPGTP